MNIYTLFAGIILIVVAAILLLRAIHDFRRIPAGRTRGNAVLRITLNTLVLVIGVLLVLHSCFGKHSALKAFMPFGDDDDNDDFEGDDDFSHLADYGSSFGSRRVRRDFDISGDDIEFDFDEEMY